MKYLFIILTIILAITVTTLFFIWPENPKGKKDILVTINGYDISRSDLQEKGGTGSHHESNGDALDSVITRQLLIEEAQKLDIDKEPSFRKELQEYYEQSLIKILTERKNASFQIQVTQQEVENFLNNFGKTFTFRFLKIRETPTAEFLRSNGMLHTARFEDLSEPIQLVLAGLKPGEMAMEYDTGNENNAILLEKIEGASAKPGSIEPERIRNILAEHKKRQLISNWIHTLRKNASITIHK